MFCIVSHFHPLYFSFSSYVNFFIDRILAQPHSTRTPSQTETDKRVTTTSESLQTMPETVQVRSFSLFFLKIDIQTTLFRGCLPLHKSVESPCEIFRKFNFCLGRTFFLQILCHSPFVREHIFVGFNKFPFLMHWCTVIHRSATGAYYLSKSEMEFYV